MPEEISQTQQNDSKPPLLWLQTILFSVTFLIAAIGVPWYGLTHGFTAAGWIGFVCFLLSGHWFVYAVGFVISGAGMWDAAPRRKHLDALQEQVESLGSDLHVVRTLDQQRLTR